MLKSFADALVVLETGENDATNMHRKTKAHLHWAVCDAAMRVEWSAWTVSRPTDPRTGKSGQDVDREERVLTKSVVA